MWSVIAHGGARAIAHWDEESNKGGLVTAVSLAARILIARGEAIDACEAAVLALEDDTTFNAGTGAVLNQDGEAELDAALMDGASLDIGAVAALIGFRNPIRAARCLLREETVLLASAGAARFAKEHGLKPTEDFTPAKGDPGHDTVGAIVCDEAGNFAVGVSTGGLAGTRAGRIGDCPLPGCGFYADNRVGAVCFSGNGERISRMMLAARVMYALENGASPQHAADAALLQLGRIGGEAGVIVMSRTGQTGIAHNSPHFAVATQSSDAPPRVQIKR